MRLDSQLAFIPVGAPLSCVGAAAQTFPSAVIDLLGEGPGISPAAGNDIIGIQGAGGTALFGADMGVGLWRPELMIAVGTTFTTGVGALLKIALQAAPDSGAAGNYQPTTWTDIVSQDNIAVANLTAPAGGLAAVPARFPWLPVFPANLSPRFLRLLFSPTSNAGVTPGGNFTAGTIAFAIVTSVRDDQTNRFARKNFTVQ